MADVDSAHGQHDHTTTEPAIREILSSLGLSARGLAWIESYSHSAWRTDEVVVRYRIIGPTGRLTHEAAVGALLPPAALYPEVIATGCSGRNDWLVTARIPGVPLAGAWTSLSDGLRERATHEAAAALRAIHGAPAQHLEPPCLYGGAEVVPRSAFIDALTALVRASAGAESNARDVDRICAQLEELRAAIDDEPSVMAHSDFHFGQCLWNDGHLVGVVDLEMSHADARDWDLPPFLGFCSDPSGTSTEIGAALRPDDFAQIPAWLHDAYPELFAHPALIARLRIYELVYRLADLRKTPDLSFISAVLRDGGHYEHLLPGMT